jgi:hypothetical protein
VLEYDGTRLPRPFPEQRKTIAVVDEDLQRYITDLPAGRVTFGTSEEDVSIASPLVIPTTTNSRREEEDIPDALQCKLVIGTCFVGLVGLWSGL